MVDSSHSTVVLSDVYSFYYDEMEMRCFRTVVNLKKLNYVESLNQLLVSIQANLKSGTVFCGCFENNKTPFHMKTGRYGRFLNALLSLADLKMKRLMSHKEVYSLLKVHAFEVQDMEEINGVTYFYAKRT